MRVLVLNCGSSSVKMRLVDTATEQWTAQGGVERIGLADGGAARFQRRGKEPRRELLAGAGFADAIRWLEERLEPEDRPQAVGHRVVHGGERYISPVVVDDAVLADLERVSALAPLHNPQNLLGIRTARELFPQLPQVAAFDTAFHATLPPRAYRYAIPERFYREHGIRRYGFHGLNHRHVSERAAARLGRSRLRLVSLHLGNGCSACAVRDGRSMDTSMGFTPLAGLVMSARPGDLDPAVPLRLVDAGLSVAEVERLLNHECGLRALSGGLSDMRDIEAAVHAGNDAARLAFDQFCYRARQFVGGYAASLGGLDALVFTGGIGEHSAAVRAEVCAGLEFLGVRLEATRNNATGEDEREIGADGAGVRALVIPADEERVIARETAAALDTINGGSAA